MYDIEVTTEIWHDSHLWWDGGTMRWFGVNAEVCNWLAASCKTTAFWLIGLPEVKDGGYELRYRTLVTQGDTTLSDTTMLSFPGLSYASVIAFQRWAVQELGEMVTLFESQHLDSPVPQIEVPRNRLRAVLSLIWQRIANTFTTKD